MKEGWEYKSLGEVCRIFNGNSINADYKKTHYMGLSEGYPFIATKDVSFDGIIDYENGVKIPFDEGLKVAKPNSVFICVEGGSAGRKIGLVNREVCFGNKLFCLDSQGSVLGPFIYYYLKSELFQDQFAERLTGLIGGVSAKKFNDISIIYPSLSEQQSIVDYLDSAFAKIDAMKANAEKALNEAKALFQASLKDMLEPKKGWEEKYLKEIAEYSIGLTYKPTDVCDDGTIVLRSSNIQDGKLDLNDIVRVNTSIKEKLYVQCGDILMCSRNGSARLVGKVCIIPELKERMTYGTFMMVIRSAYNPFLYHYFDTDLFRRQIKHGEANMINQITRYMLDDVKLNLPPIKEQQSIVATLDSLKSKVDRLQANYDKISQECDALKQAILRHVFE